MCPRVVRARVTEAILLCAYWLLKAGQVCALLLCRNRCSSPVFVPSFNSSALPVRASGISSGTSAWTDLTEMSDFVLDVMRRCALGRLCCERAETLLHLYSNNVAEVFREACAKANVRGCDERT